MGCDQTMLIKSYNVNKNLHETELLILRENKGEIYYRADWRVRCVHFSWVGRVLADVLMS